MRGMCYLVAINLLYGACEDPSPPPKQGSLVIKIRVVPPAEPDPALSGGMGESLEGLAGLSVTVTRVDVVHRTDINDASTEKVITVDSTERSFTLVSNLEHQASRQLVWLTVPVGHVMQVRFIVKDSRITLRGQEHVLNISSGSQTGLKIEPIDGVPFEIIENAITGGQIVFDPFEKMIRNQGEGFKLKPVLEAEHLSIYQAKVENGIVLGEVIVRFKDGTAQSDIDAAISNVGAEVLSSWPPTNYYRLKLAPDMSLREALEHFDSRNDVLYTVPNTLLSYFQTDPLYVRGYQPQMAQIAADQAWSAGYTGNMTPVVAVIDSGTQLDHYDLINNIWINEAEIPTALTDDVNPADGFMDGDFDQDGHITFRDFNMVGLDAIQQAILTGIGLTPRSGPLDPLNTPNQFITAVSDSNDPDDGGQYPDDIVGWDFEGTGSNLPTPHVMDPSNPYEVLAHGTEVAGIIGAETNNGRGAAGTAWFVRLMIIRPDVFHPFGNWDDEETGILRSSAYEAILYAASKGADVINISFGGTVTRDGEGKCSGQTGVYDLDPDKYEALIARLNQELVDLHMNRGTTLMVVAAGNCKMNLDRTGVYVWPAAVSSPSLITVGGVKAADAVDDRYEYTNYGIVSTHIAAPATNFRNLVPFGSTIPADSHVAGTSWAAPMVSGVAALLLAHDPTLRDNPCHLADQIIRNGDPLSVLENFIGATGYRLNAYTALTNSVTTPVRSCP